MSVAASCPSSLTTMRTTRSARLFARALQILPGGVDSPVRAFKAVGGSPLFIRRASGAHIEDVDGNRFIDYVMSWGPLIHGHAPRGLVKALAAAARDGTSFGAPLRSKSSSANGSRELMPSIERVRFVNSGTEATMSAIRVAQGGYRARADRQVRRLLPRARRPVPGQGGLRGADARARRPAPGVTRAAVADTLVASYNDLGSVERLFDAHRDQIAAVDRGADRRQHGRRSAGRRAFCARFETCAPRGKALLIFDEVISGFRAAPGGAQQLAGVDAGPDVPRQDHRRRTAGRRVWRPRRPDGARVSRRSRLSGRHAERQSAGDDRGPVVSRSAARPARTRIWQRLADSAGRRALRRRRGRPAWHCRSTLSVPC